MSSQKRCVLGSFITTVSYAGFLSEIFHLVSQKVPSYICFANVHMVIEAYRKHLFQKIVNAATLVAPDGKPLSVFLRLMEGLKQERVCGMDIFPDLLARAEASGKSVYFYGTTPSLLKAIAVKAKAEFPALRIAGYFSPPFRELTPDENAEIVDMIRAAKPDLVFVSLGCPKQERWMSENHLKIGSCLLGLGQAFKVYAGEERRLPRWMRNLSLEWSYRLYLEPRRLWKRYLVTNSWFVFLSTLEILRRRVGGVFLSSGKDRADFHANHF